MDNRIWLENYVWHFRNDSPFGCNSCIWFLLRDYPEDKGLQPYGADLTGKEGTAEEGIEYAKAIRMPEFYGLILFAFMMILVSTLHLLIPVYVTKLDFSLEVAGFVAAGVMAGGTLGKIALGIINDRNNKLGILTSSGLGVVGFFLLLNGHFAGLWSVVAGGFLFGWAYAGTTVQTMMLVRTVFGSKNYAQIYSKVSIALPCGGILAAAEGLLADKSAMRLFSDLPLFFYCCRLVSGSLFYVKNSIDTYYKHLFFTRFLISTILNNTKIPSFTLLGVKLGVCFTIY